MDLRTVRDGEPEPVTHLQHDHDDGQDHEQADHKGPLQDGNDNRHHYRPPANHPAEALPCVNVLRMKREAAATEDRSTGNGKAGAG